MPDAHANLAYSTVATAPSPAASGTSLVVGAGQGALFPAVPFNATVWPAGANPLTTNAEIIRVTAVATDTLTIVRAQEGTSARTVVVGDQIANTITAKVLTDVEADVSNAASAIVANSAQMTSADNAISNTVSIVSVAVAVVSAEVTSVKAVVSNQGSAIVANSAQMTSADNAVSNAVSIVSVAAAGASAAAAAVSAAVTSINAVISNLASDVSANSAQMTSADNAISAAVAALSAQHTSLANSVANFAISELAGVSLAALSDGQVLKWNSAAAQWVNSTDATGGGGGSVTSAEAEAISAAAASADGTLSLRIDSVMTVLSNLASDVSANSAQMTSADNAISAAAAGASAAAAAASAAITSVNQIVSVISQQVSVLSVRVAGVSAQMTSADNAISLAAANASAAAAGASAAAAVVSAAVTSVNAVLSNLTSAHNALSNTVSGLGGGGASVTSAEHQSLVDRVSANSAAGGGGGSVTSNELSIKAPWPEAVIRIMSTLQSTNGSALVNLSGLVLTVAADQTWEIDGMFLFSTSATTVGLKLGTSVPPLSTPRAFIFNRVSGGQSAGMAGGAGQMQVSGASTNMSITGAGPAGGVYPVHVKAIFNVASAGTVQFMYAGIASTAASPIHALPGSYFKALRLK